MKAHRKESANLAYEDKKGIKLNLKHQVEKDQVSGIACAKA